MLVLPEFAIVASWVIGGVFYDQIKIVTTSAYDLAKISLAKKLPLENNELDIIEAEIVSCDEEVYESQELLYEFITQNSAIQEVLKDVEQREPEKSKEIINSFKNNQNSKLDLTLGDINTIKSSFNSNKDSEIIIK